ncbi:hypothetical protein C922_05678 [Plasmodium inui San Antonio 1]|uniref:Uncharacterized protein n=1 Tax=Plasmodium inui San Antonio 1 TaxID=1237626 RepID=W7A4B3_9APIC|nr:hypothetical protein C922_05678 [Plasmodium inui San Antonio 1]EUD63939.1 hypothetical protein C922_05678 [Plasmodium inui San Antonio 1]
MAFQGCYPSLPREPPEGDPLAENQRENKHRISERWTKNDRCHLKHEEVTRREKFKLTTPPYVAPVKRQETTKLNNSNTTAPPTGTAEVAMKIEKVPNRSKTGTTLSNRRRRNTNRGRDLRVIKRRRRV